MKTNDEVTDKYLSEIDDLTRTAVQEAMALFFPVVNQKEETDK